ncbi:spore coat protein [Peribacillus muralis]|uniref:CotD family spore coat protein n=1 Tax=Peribacillus muralis TaxID=264697 RepID=UPI001F4D66E4|nr:CotD family spore coat protein [Peribacillus muralis]MCK1991265.1 spore coat protein [Peribacillus muralis]MCK2011819.1 spore coat protein [Peribacillus muralis]
MNFRNCGGNNANVMGAYGNAPGVMGVSSNNNANVMGVSNNNNSNVMGVSNNNVMGAYNNNNSNVMGVSNNNNSNVMGAYSQPMQTGPTQSLPSQVAPAQVNPTKQYVNTNVSNTVIPVVHPSHTTTVNKHVNTYKHYFPHTQSVVNECYTQNLICGRPHNPCCPPRHLGY